MRVRFPRFTILQLLLASALIALVLGLFTSAWRVASQQSVASVHFSPSGKYLAAQYSSGAIQVWRLDERGPRRVAMIPARSWQKEDVCWLHFVADDRLLALEVQYGSTATTIVRAIDVATGRNAEIMRVAGDPSFDSSLVVATPQRVVFVEYEFGTTPQTLFVVCDLSSGAVTRSAPKPPGMAVAVSPSAERAIVLGSDGDHLVDVESGQSIAQLNVPQASRSMALSPDGTTLALARYSNNQGQVEAVIAVRSVAEEAEQWLFTGFDNADWIRFSNDGRRIAVGHLGAVGVFELSGGKRLSRIELDREGIRYRDAELFSPDCQWFAASAGGQITLWDATTGEVRHTITGGSRTLQVMIFTLGFSLWAAAWGMARKHERLRRQAAQASRGEAASQQTLTAGSPAKPPDASAATIRPALVGTGYLLLFLFTVALVLLWDRVDVRMSGELAAFALLLLLGLIFLGPLLALLHGWAYGRAAPPPGLPAAPSDGNASEVSPRHIALARLRELMDDEGRLHEQGQLQVWCTGRAYCEPRLLRDYEEVCRHAEELFGKPMQLETPTLIAVLDRQADYDAFFGGHVSPPGAIWSDGVMVICEEVAVTEAAHPAAGLRSVLALLLSAQHKGGQVRGWANLLMLLYLVRYEDHPVHIHGSVRRLRAQLQRRPNWNPQTVLQRSTEERARLWLAVDDGQARREAVADADFIIAAGECLLGDAAPHERREAALRWLRKLQPQDDPLAALQRECGLSADELVAAIRRWVDEQPADPYDPMPPLKQHLLRTFVSPRLLSRKLPSHFRQRAVRQLFACDYVAAAEPLLALLDDEDAAVRGEAVTALENISGKLYGDEPAQWRRWWDDLPPAVKPKPRTGATPIADRPDAIEVYAPPPAANEGPAPTSPPAALQLAWVLMTLGGLVALLLVISFLFFWGPLIFPTIYVALLVGVSAIARGASRDTHQVQSTAIVQVLNLVACDPINLLLAVCELNLLSSAEVQRYLRHTGAQ